MKKFYLYTVIFIFFGLLILTWNFAHRPKTFNNTIHSCIHSNLKKLKFKFATSSSAIFEISFVANTEQQYINPYFPAIHITTNVKHNAWIHIVYTDAKDKALRMFIDSENPNKENSIYPFYTFESGFYDAPFWTYSLFSRPLNFWKGNAFALDIDHQNRTVKCLGGIEWGFKLHFLTIRPVAINPKLLNQVDWNKIWPFIKEQLPRYIVIDM